MLRLILNCPVSFTSVSKNFAVPGRYRTRLVRPGVQDPALIWTGITNAFTAVLKTANVHLD